MTVKSLVLATGNPGKIREMRNALRGMSVRVLAGPRFGPRRPVAETGRTLEANAVKKARAWARASRCTALADDTGLAVAALGGRPGVKSARYAGPECQPADNMKKLLRALARYRGAKRKAVFRCVIALAEPAGRVRLFEGRCAGRIAESIQGRGGFGYDPVFVPQGGVRSFGQMTLAEKHRISHRARALAKFAAWWKRSLRD